MHVVHNDQRVGLERIHDQLIKGFLERHGMFCGGGFHELFHVQESAADSSVKLSQDRGLAAASAAPHTKN